MHIVIIADPIDNQNAGVHFYTKNLVSSLLETDKKNKYTFIHQKENPFFKNTDNYIIKSSRFPGVETFRRTVLIPRLIKRINPDIAIEPCHLGPFCLPKSIKRATIIYDMTPILFRKFHIKISWILHKLLLKRVLKKSDLIIAISNTTKSDILSYYPMAKNINIVNAAIRKAKPIQEHKDLSKRIKQIKKPYLLYLGTIEPRKNLTMLIEAFDELKKEKSIEHSLVIAGELGWKTGPFLEKLKELKNRDIILTGKVTEEEKTFLYKNSDIFIYPSIYEGFGLPPLEAMSHNIPVICSNGGSLGKIFKDSSIQFPPDDKKKLKSAIRKLANNQKEKEKLIKKGQELSSQYSWKKSAIQMIEALEKTNINH